MVNYGFLHLEKGEDIKYHLVEVGRMNQNRGNRILFLEKYVKMDRVKENISPWDKTRCCYRNVQLLFMASKYAEN